MKKVNGIGGVFFKAKDPKALAAWYHKHLDILFDDYNTHSFTGNNDNSGMTVFSFFKETTDYLKPSDKPFMINFRVNNLAELLSELKQNGVEPEGEMQEYEYGKFGWIMDPEGNKIELWEPAKE